MNRYYQLAQQRLVGISAAAPDSASPKEVSVTASSRTSAHSAASSHVSEESWKIVQRLFLMPDQAPPRIVVFAAIDSGASSSICATSAEVLAQSVSGQVCFIQPSLCTQPVPRLFPSGNHYGFADSLRQQGAMREFARKRDQDNLWLLSPGAQGGDYSCLLNSDRLKQRIADLRNEFSFVLIDAPPLNSHADAMVLGRLTDGIVIVLQANATRREAAIRVAERLQAAKVSVLGAVLVDRTFPIPAALYKRL